ncbi:hypothetical protein QBC38DRAFT_455198 [Podospora fimiseda]|uniref:Uncharacterized protein n=1 Tax=Podospora fimiseda TaxID=252190 RepID=A0AAN7GZ84_9PEZI|nr:hypothetical protein QBC38DRAFT_455198 [Podospora fimiseda]
MTKVGVWNTNLPVSNPVTPSKRKQSTRNASNKPETARIQTKTERMTGAVAFMKPNLNWDDFGISFQICDFNGSSANGRFVSWNRDWTPSQARVQAMTNWDFHESKRVIDYNILLTVYWAMVRLLFHLVAEAGPGNIAMPVDITENCTELERGVISI